MTQMWIDEQYFDGDKGFLVESYDGNNGSTHYTLRNTPAYTNRSNEPRLHGWCGSYNNLSTTGYGAWKVIRVAKSGRVLIKELEGEELNEFLEEMGYPELIP